MKNIDTITSQTKLKEIINEYDKLKIELDNDEVFSKVRSSEPALVSSFTSKPTIDQKLETIVITYDGCHVGGISFFTYKNEMRKNDRNLYSRIDIVVVPRLYQGLGISKMLILLAIQHLNLTYDKRMYSISCLAAHKAIEKVLEGLEFIGTQDEDKNFKRESISFDDIDYNAFKLMIDKNISSVIHKVNYNLHGFISEGKK